MKDCNEIGHVVMICAVQTKNAVRADKKVGPVGGLYCWRASRKTPPSLRHSGYSTIVVTFIEGLDNLAMHLESLRSKSLVCQVNMTLGHQY